MNAIIQHNFTSGLGDSIVAVHEYIETASNLISNGYRVNLKLNLSKNQYFHDNDFFKVFNRDLYSIFDNIELLSTPIDNEVYNNYNRVYTLANPKPGMHWWDLFINNGTNIDTSLLSLYPQEFQNTPKKIDIFSADIIDGYKKNISNISDEVEYESIYVRTLDLHDKIPSGGIDKVRDILEIGKPTFICSNSYNVKKEIKDLGHTNSFLFDIPEEQKYGNHFYNRKLDFSDSDVLLERTKFTIYDMIALSESSKINFISDWGRMSNFLILAKINKTTINTII